MYWGWTRNRYNPAPCYSNKDIIKKSLLILGPQTIEELIPQVEEVFPGHGEEYTRMILDPEKHNIFIPLPDGRWDVKREETIEHRYAYEVLKEEMRPLKEKELEKKIRRKFHISKDVTINLKLLKSDPNFVQRSDTGEYELTEWIHINDIAYNYMVENKINGIKLSELKLKISKEIGVDKSNVVFLYKDDVRFSVKNKKVYLNVSQEEIEINNSIIEPLEQIAIPPQYMQNAREKRRDVFRLLRDAEGSRLLTDIAGELYDQRDLDFPIYCEALRNVLEEDDSFIRVGRDRWTIKEKVPEIVYTNPGTISVPRVSSKTELPDEALEEELTEMVLEIDGNEDKDKEFSGVVRKKVKYTLSYYHIENGILSIRKRERVIFPKYAQLQEITFIDQYGSLHRCWLNNTNNLLYGLKDWFAENLVDVGSIIYIQPSSKNGMYYIEYNGEIDSLRHIEENRLKDLIRLREQALKADKSILDIIIDIMRGKKEGIHYKRLFEEVNVIRGTTSRTVASILSSYHCFYNRGDRSGIWYFDENKLAMGRKWSKKRYIRVNIKESEEPKADPNIIKSLEKYFTSHFRYTQILDVILNRDKQLSSLEKELQHYNHIILNFQKGSHYIEDLIKEVGDREAYFKILDYMYHSDPFVYFKLDFKIVKAFNGRNNKKLAAKTDTYREDMRKIRDFCEFYGIESPLEFTTFMGFLEPDGSSDDKRYRVSGVEDILIRVLSFYRDGLPREELYALVNCAIPVTREELDKQLNEYPYYELVDPDIIKFNPFKKEEYDRKMQELVKELNQVKEENEAIRNQLLAKEQEIQRLKERLEQMKILEREVQAYRTLMDNWLIRFAVAVSGVKGKISKDKYPDVGI